MIKNMFNQVAGFVRRNVDKALIVAGVLMTSSVFAPAAKAATPTDLDGVAALGMGYISTATSVAVAAAVLGFGWVGYRIVKKFTKGATST